MLHQVRFFFNFRNILFTQQNSQRRNSKLSKLADDNKSTNPISLPPIIYLFFDPTPAQSGVDNFSVSKHVLCILNILAEVIQK